MFTAYENIYNTTAIEEFGGDAFETLQEFSELGSFAQKQNAPLLCPSAFNGTRKLDNHVVSTCIGLDIDRGITMDDTKSRLQSLGLGSCIYTTASSRNLDRFRVFIKFSAPVRSTDDYKAIWKVMNAALNGSVDIMTQHAACLFYVPSQVQGADNEMYMTDGQKIDVDHYIDLGRDITDSTQPKYPVIPRSPRTYAGSVDIAGFVTYDPELTILDDSPFAMQAYIDEYLNLLRGAHYLGLYTFMTRVAGYAKSRNTIVSVRHLTLLAQQLDQRDGGYYANRPIQIEAENVVEFVYGGTA